MSPNSIPLIQNGTLKNTLVSSRSAKEYGVESNFAESGEYLRSPRMEAGNLNQENVTKEIDRGLYLSNIHYLNWSDNAGGRITGLTRYACFWVENGEIQYPISELTIAGNLLDMLKSIIPANDAREYVSRVVPSLLIDGMTIAGS